ncbi:50S ribosomal protein L24 [Roseimaritima multifibrata]|uniref:Large ribosomal subunit protein uL24 n=1 Tax=Roseimaritima multifibrata TaxID=1930274 RepID=A0A517MDN5_9BACT|nr:50S ribosomal protein L24 [Roseimaritima multifibrata]QDS92946.1 50S ribosomal protein L24 [Roseimaritima multifibrata]
MLFRVDDQVVVIAGASRGLKGKILKVDRQKNKVIVEGVARVYKHVRRSQKNPQGGRLSKEMPISASNVMLVDPTNGEATRIGIRYLSNGSKERYAKKSNTGLGEISPPNPKYAQQA